MSELLDESRQRKDKAIEDKKTCGNGLSYGLFKGKEMAWEEAVDLIEKHEKPKGLIDVIGEWEDIKKSMATVARHKQCKYCHEPHEYIFIYEENKPNPDILRVFIDADNCLHIQQKDYSFADPNIKYCPMCGRDLSEVEE